MYPSRNSQPLISYELFLDPETMVQPFDAVYSGEIQDLRLSGDCHLPIPPKATPSLRHVTLHGVTGNSFDLRTLDEYFPGAQLESFSYAYCHKLGFEIRNRHLESLVNSHPVPLRKLVLLGCSRITSTAIATCLHNLPLLEYFALSLVTVDELRTNFVLALSSKVSMVKLHVINAWYAVPLLDEERAICDAIEDTLLNREIPPTRMWVCFRTRLMSEDGRQERWEEISRRRSIGLSVGPWEKEYLDNM